MFSWLARILLTATALAPAGLSYAWVAFSDGHLKASLIILGVCVILFAICLFLLHYAQKNIERQELTTTSMEPVDGEVIASLLLYILPLFTANFASLNWDVWPPALVIFLIIVSTGYAFQFNPLLNVMGWHFFKVHTPEGITYLLITKQNIKNVKQVIIGGQLTEYIMIDLGEKTQ